jgi:hypothetical protein
MDDSYAFLRTQAKDLEDSFFHKEDEKLIERMRAMKKMKETKENLAKVSGIANDEILQKMVDLNISPDIAASLAIVPLVEVAWADGSIDDRERTAVLRAAPKAGVNKGTIDHVLIEQWLSHRPGPHMLDAWIHYMSGLCEKLSPKERAELKSEILGHARAVAEAAGGLLGLGPKISRSEKEMLDKLSSAFESCK